MTSRQLAVLLTLASIWGASFLFIKVLVDAGVGATGVTAGRSSLGFLTLVPLAYRFRNQFPRDRKTWAALAFLGLLNFGLPWTLFGIAAQHAPSGASSVVNALQPLWAALFAVVLLKSEQFGARRVTGLILGFAGVCALMGQDMLDSDRAGAGAIVLMAGATACYALAGVLIGRWLRHVPAFPLGFAQVGFSALYLLPIALATGAYSHADFTPGPVLSLLVLGGGGSGLAIVAFMWLIQQIGPVRAAVVTYLLPPVGVTLGWLVLGEPVGWNLILGLAFIISGVALVQGTPAAALFRRLSPGPAREPVVEPAE